MVRVFIHFAVVLSLGYNKNFILNHYSGHVTEIICIFHSIAFEQARVFPSINAKSDVMKREPPATPLTIIQKLLLYFVVKTRTTVSVWEWLKTHLKLEFIPNKKIKMLTKKILQSE